MTLFYDELDELEKKKKKECVCVLQLYEHYCIVFDGAQYFLTKLRKKNLAHGRLFIAFIPWPWLLPTDLNYIKEAFFFFFYEDKKEYQESLQIGI